MDLVSSGVRVIIVMEHMINGETRVFEQCTIPLTGTKVVDTLITELAVYKMRDGELVLTEFAKESSID